MVPLILPVPYVYQYGSPWCGPASTAMILKYFGEELNYWEIAEVLKIGRDSDLSIKDSREYIKGHNDLNVGSKRSWYWRSIFEWRGLKSYLVSSLDSGAPVFLKIPTTKKRNNERLSHAVVIVGYIYNPDISFYVNDPSGALFESLNLTYKYRAIIAKPVDGNKLNDLCKGGNLVEAFKVSGKPNPPNGTLLFGDRSCLILGNDGFTYHTWLDDGLKWKETSSNNLFPIEHPIPYYSSKYEIIQFNIEIANQRNFEQQYLVNITDESNLVLVSERFTVGPFNNIRAPRIDLYPVPMAKGPHLVYVKLLDLDNKLVDQIGPLAINVVG